MRVFITGATGVLGHRLVERLFDRGHKVVGLTRNEEGDDLVERRGGTPRRGNVLDQESLTAALDDADVVVHAATKIPTKTKPTAEDWAQNARIRVEGARNVVTAAVDAGATRMLFPSVVWVARQPDGSSFDETVQRHPDRTTQSAADAEDVLHEAAQTHGLDIGILRCGFFYAPDSTHTRQFAQNLLSRTLPIVGGGVFGRRDAELSLLHVDDAAQAFADATEADATGCWHVVDEEPVTVAEFFRAFADTLDAPRPFRVPAWLARPLAGEDTVRLLTHSMPTSNDRFKQEIGWEPVYPTYRKGLQQVVETWINDGTLRETTNGYEWTDE